MRNTHVTIFMMGDRVDIENNIDMIMEAVDTSSVNEFEIQISHGDIEKDD